jgi:hypothetical protein
MNQRNPTGTMVDANGHFSVTCGLMRWMSLKTGLSYLVALAVVTSAGAEGVLDLSAEPALKPRRVLYNLDGDSCMTLIAGRRGPGPVTSADFARLAEELTAPGSQVDTLLVCVNAQVTYYPTKVGTLRGTLSTPEERARWSPHERQRFANMQAFFEAGVDPYGVILAEAKRRGLEVLLTFRMNDAHGNDFLRTAFWQEHPEFRLANSALDYAHEEVREYVFRLIEEAVQRYPCNGLELDFQRFPTFFQLGGSDSPQQRMDKITSLVARIRHMLDAEGARRGQRLVLSARVPSGYDQQPPTCEKSRELGCDPAEWARKSWIDFLTVSEWLFTAESLGIRAWKQQVAGIPIYAGIQPEAKPSQTAARADFPLGMSGYEKFARERWADEADGIYLFNFFTSREWPEPSEPPFEVLSHLAGPSSGGPWPELRDVRKIWDAAPHNAFTDLARSGDKWYCVFREGSGHIPGSNGVVRVLHSSDGERWESAAVLAERGVDLRDPKLSVMPNGRLMLLMGGSIYEGQEGVQERKFVSAHTRVAFADAATQWSAPQPVSVEGEWLWRVTWQGGSGYGFGYTFNVPAKDVSLTLWRTRDGVKYEPVARPKLPAPCWPDETTVRFLSDGTMIALVRNERNAGPAFFGRSSAPYAVWEWVNARQMVQGPNIIIAETDRVFYAGRDYRPGPVTALGSIASSGGWRQFVLPSGGDTSYPGMVWHAGQIWMSYYSSHEGKTAIYFSRIDVPPAPYANKTMF